MGAGGFRENRYLVLLLIGDKRLLITIISEDSTVLAQ